jgi:hypothetical protein
MQARMRIAPIAATLVAVLLSCSDSDPGATNMCTGTLASVGEHCPATYDGTEANLPACPAPGDVGFPVADRTVWQCQDLIILQYGSGFAALVCSYDTTSHALVGAERGDDTPCDPQHFSVQAGRTN